MDELELESQPMIVCTQTVHNHYMVMMSEVFGDVKNYDSVYATLVEAQETDVVEFVINNNGGNFFALAQIIAGIQQSEALTVATITCSADSCASMLSLSCDEIRVLPLGEMLIHHTSACMPLSKMSDGLKSTMFLAKQTERAFRLCYTGFLTEEEILQCLNGTEMHMDSDEINERLEKLMEYREAALESTSATKH